MAWAHAKPETIEAGLGGSPPGGQGDALVNIW